MPKYVFTVHTALGPMFPDEEPRQLESLKEAKEHALALSEVPFIHLDEDDGKGAIIPTEAILAVTFYDEERMQDGAPRIELLH
jgi:hypothetical protein